jgi:hypothetical protein
MVSLYLVEPTIGNSSAPRQMLLHLVSLTLSVLPILAEPMEGYPVFAFDQLNRNRGCIRTSLSDHQGTRNNAELKQQRN